GETRALGPHCADDTHRGDHPDRRVAHPVLEQIVCAHAAEARDAVHRQDDRDDDECEPDDPAPPSHSVRAGSCVDSGQRLTLRRRRNTIAVPPTTATTMATTTTAPAASSQSGLVDAPGDESA